MWLTLAAVLAIGYSYRFELTDLVDRLGGEIVPYAAVTTEDGAVRVRAHRDGHFYIDSASTDRTSDFWSIPVRALWR